MFFYVNSSWYEKRSNNIFIFVNLYSFIVLFKFQSCVKSCNFNSLFLFFTIYKFMSLWNIVSWFSFIPCNGKVNVMSHINWKITLFAVKTKSCTKTLTLLMLQTSLLERRKYNTHLCMWHSRKTLFKSWFNSLLLVAVFVSKLFILKTTINVYQHYQFSTNFIGRNFAFVTLLVLLF